jgi:hypothetical protein
MEDGEEKDVPYKLRQSYPFVKRRIAFVQFLKHSNRVFAPRTSLELLSPFFANWDYGKMSADRKTGLRVRENGAETQKLC